MELLQLRYYCVVAETQSMTLAAEKLHISQPALSKTIKHIEDELGVPLFDHVGRTIRLNLCGKLFYNKIKTSLSVIDNAIQEVRDTAGEPYGTVLLLVLTARSILPEFYIAFREKYPYINLKLNSYIPSEQQLVSSYDFCITDMPLENTYAGWAKRILYHEEFVLVVKLEHPLKEYGQSIDFIEAAPYPLILPWSGSNLPANVTRLCRLAGFEPSSIIEGDNSRTLISMVKAGIGIALLPISMLPDAQNGGLHILRLTNTERYRTIQLLWDNKRYLSKAAKEFMKSIIDFFKDYARRNTETRQNLK